MSATQVTLNSPLAAEDTTYVDPDGVTKPAKILKVAVAAGTASDGSALPANFDSKGSVTTFTPNAATATSKVETKVIGAVTYTRTTTFSPSADALVTKTTGDWIAS
jgi:hypothetical protein